MGQYDKLDMIAAMFVERQYQDDKHGTIEEHPHTVAEWVLIAEAEIQEAKQAWCKGSDRDALRELVQAAAVVLACLEQHGVVER